MMKKIISLTFGLLMTMAAWGQSSAAVDTLTPAQDSVSIGSHTEFAAAKISDDNVTKAEGDSAYMRNDYASAIQIYESLLKKGEAAEIYYNLGNSYYKADDIAKAILNYERALLLQPGNADIRANLEIARSKTIDKVVSVPDIFFVAWVKSLINCLSVDAWAKLGIVFFILLLISFSLFFLSKNLKNRFILAQSAGKENMVAQGKNTGYNDCGQEEREERKSKNKREKEGKSEYDKSLYL